MRAYGESVVGFAFASDLMKLSLRQAIWMYRRAYPLLLDEMTAAGFSVTEQSSIMLEDSRTVLSHS
jgi:hypothetical protein